MRTDRSREGRKDGEGAGKGRGRGWGDEARAKGRGRSGLVRSWKMLSMMSSA